MLGDMNFCSELRGMTPRVFEHLFARIQEEEESRRHEQLRFNCKCSYLEIYNESITDLLDPSRTNLSRQKKKQLLQEQGFWIGKRGEKMERRAQKEDEGNDTASQQGNDKVRAPSGGGSMREDKTRREEHNERKWKAVARLERLIRLHELLRENCEWILEGETKVDGRLRKVEEERRRKLEVRIQELQERMKEKTELLTQGVASLVPEILKEIQRLRAREKRRDVQWTKVEKEMESLKTEVERAKIEQGKLEVRVEALSTALDNKSKEVETGKMKKERLKKEVGKLEARVSEQGKAIEAEKNERKQECDK
ncbi:hypothetical protein CBR_g31029 [Chara braunii]|uniref:Kinesin motor domain-containing protein n=1 Tax=Chara braunii TaxID=69332 RepID=A0A388LE36_CHABU|nr:hypothetical protein CBR_g31029 [Chara braunii]|eukprot:GBG80569.1 hypothetical protein CBR_g31029 [Chara braunii]